MADDFPTSESYVEYVKTQEAFRAWPYPDGEDKKGNPKGYAIGFGRFRSKYKTREEAVQGFGAPWSEEQGDEAVREDIRKAYKGASTYVSKTHGDDAWNSLSAFEQEALADYEFNPGISEFPKLTRAIVERDRLRIAKEFRRYTAGDELGRNKAWWAKYGKKMTGIKYRDTRPVDRLISFLDDIGVYTGDL